MARVHIKICGLTTPDAAEATVAARADFGGFVFYPPSPRFLTLGQAAELGGQMSGRIRKIGLFVDADDAFIADCVGAAGLDGLQLQGSETPERAAALRARFGLPVWKTVSVAKAEDVAKADRYVGAADLILFDAKTPKGTLPGGMGLSFDWTLLNSWKGQLPWGLAGGLDPDNVAEAVRLTGAPLVDVSSGVQASPERKDPAKIAAFCTAVRAA